jgi:hypothetical protein
MQRLLLTMTPALMLCLLFTFMLFRSAGKPSQKPWLLPPPGANKNRPAPNTFARSFMGWMLFVSVAILLFVVVQSRRSAGIPGAPPPTRLPMTFDFILPFVPIFLLLLAIGVFSAMTSRRAMQRMWDSMRPERAPRTLRADTDAVVIEQATASMRYDWPHFAGYKETKNLLLVYLSPYSFHMIPKRAFISPADLDAFKGLLMSGVPEGNFLPSEQSAFPVVPIPIAFAPKRR